MYCAGIPAPCARSATPPHARADLDRHRQQSADVSGLDGPGSEEAKQAIEETRQALMKDADAALAAARSADAAAANVQIVKDNLQQVLTWPAIAAWWSIRWPARYVPCRRAALPNDWHNAAGAAAGATTGSGASE